MNGFVLGTRGKKLPGSPTAKDLSVLESKPLFSGMHHNLKSPGCIEKSVGAKKALAGQGLNHC